MSINESKYLLGFAVLMINIGARHIPNDLGTYYQSFIENDLIKRFILFSLFFVSTRDVVISLSLTLVFSFVVFGFLHDKSKYSLIRSKSDIDAKMNEYFGNSKS
jgi:hypothetical protein